MQIFPHDLLRFDIKAITKQHIPLVLELTMIYNIKIHEEIPRRAVQDNVSVNHMSTEIFFAYLVF